MENGSASAALPRDRANRLTVFGAPPLIAGENESAYEEILGRISAAVKPNDILEELWVRDVVDLVWEALRLRRLKSSLLAASASEGLEIVLRSLCDRREPERLAKGWARNEPAAREEVDKLLNSAGLSMDAVMAQTLSLKISDIERIDRLARTHEARRDTVLREIERHRITLGQALRRASEVEEGEFKEVEAPQLAASLSD